MNRGGSVYTPRRATARQRLVTGNWLFVVQSSVAQQVKEPCPAVSQVAAASWWHAGTVLHGGFDSPPPPCLSTRWLVASTCTAPVFSRRLGRVSRAETDRFFSSRTLVKMMAISYRGEAVGCSGGRPGPGSKGGAR